MNINRTSNFIKYTVKQNNYLHDYNCKDKDNQNLKKMCVNLAKDLIDSIIKNTNNKSVIEDKLSNIAIRIQKRVNRADLTNQAINNYIKEVNNLLTNEQQNHENQVNIRDFILCCILLSKHTTKDETKINWFNCTNRTTHLKYLANKNNHKYNDIGSMLQSDLYSHLIKAVETLTEIKKEEVMDILFSNDQNVRLTFINSINGRIDRSQTQILLDKIHFNTYYHLHYDPFNKEVSLAFIKLLSEKMEDKEMTEDQTKILFDDINSNHTFSIDKDVSLALINLINEKISIKETSIINDIINTINQNRFFSDKDVSLALINLIDAKMNIAKMNKHQIENLFYAISNVLFYKDNEVKLKLINLIDKIEIDAKAMSINQTIYIYNFYFEYLDHESTNFKEIEKLILDLLLKNRIQDPEVLKKIANRLNSGAIDIPYTNQGVEFFIKLCLSTSTPLINILCSNIKYFIQKDGEDVIKKVLENNLLISPLEHNNIEQLVEENLINELVSIKEDINKELISSVLIYALRSGALDTSTTNIIKQEIKTLGNGCNNNQFHNINEDSISELIQAIKANHANNKYKLIQIKQNIRDIFFNQENSNENIDANELSAINAAIKEFANKLNLINIKEIQKQYIEDTYLSLLSIEKDKFEDIYNIINNYYNWNQSIKKLKEQKYKDIYDQVISYDKGLQLNYHNIYYDYVLNTLPYRSYENILSIMKNENIPERYKQKFKCIVTYCQLNNFDNNDSTPLNIFIVKNKKNQENQENEENILITLQNLDYLNNKNITGFSLEQFKINSFTTLQYKELKDKLDNIEDCKDDDLVEFDQNSYNKLFHNLSQLKSNNSESIDQDITAILDNFIEKKSISKANLNKIIENDIVKDHLKEIESQELTLNHVDQIRFPKYLEDLINNKFTASNIVAKHINLSINSIISQYGFKVTIEQKTKLEEICYQVAVTPGRDITIDLKLKKDLINNFEDGKLLTTEYEDTNTNCEKKLIPAGDFIQLKNHLEDEFKTITDKEQQLKKLPKLLIKKAEQLEFTKNNGQVLDELFNDLKKLPSLKDNIFKHEIAYILGVIFMDISSVNVLGYHTVKENTAFTRFRLLGAYWLTKSVDLSDNKWEEHEKLAISKEIKDAILSGECSGQIVNRLYGKYCVENLIGLEERIQLIMNAKVKS